MSTQSPPIEDEIQLLDNKIKQLKMEYEQYFMGARPREPIVTKGEVQKLVTRFQNTPIQNTALRFRFNNICSRYFAFRRQWDAILRRIEDGTYERQVFRANLRDRERAEAKAEHSDAKAGAVPSDRDIFDSYVAAREKCGEGTKGVTRKKLEKVISKQRDAILEKYNCKDVRFRVVVEGGKTKLKASPVR